MTPNERMERAQWDTFWVPEEARVIARPEVLYITCPRPVFYLNQVFRTRPPRARWPALVDEVCAAHAHSASCWTLFDTVDMSAMVTPLTRAGYQLRGNCDAMVVDPSVFRPARAADITVRRVANRVALLHSLAIMEEAFDTPAQHPDAELRQLLDSCTGARARVARLVAYDREDRPIATGCMNLYPDLQLAYLWGGSTLPDARGQGAYGALLGARVQVARELGLTTVGVYAMRDTSAPILERRGFRRCGAMEKWQKSP